MRVKAVTLIFCLCLLLGLSACGNKGALTLPDEEHQKSKSASA